MTHDDLIKKIGYPRHPDMGVPGCYFEECSRFTKNPKHTLCPSCVEVRQIRNNKALRAVVELHQPQDIMLPDGSWGENCCVCNNGWTYPCRTIQVIEKELG
jgi:hypothetical protein